MILIFLFYFQMDNDYRGRSIAYPRKAIMRWQSSSSRKDVTVRSRTPGNECPVMQRVWQERNQQKGVTGILKYSNNESINIWLQISSNEAVVISYLVQW